MRYQESLTEVCASANKLPSFFPIFSRVISRGLLWPWTIPFRRLTNAFFPRICLWNALQRLIMFFREFEKFFLIYLKMGRTRILKRKLSWIQKTLEILIFVKHWNIQNIYLLNASLQIFEKNFSTWAVEVWAFRFSNSFFIFPEKCS